VTLLQVAVPTREHVPAYRELRREVSELVGDIVGEFATPEWAPIVYVHRPVPRRELAAMYTAADVAWVSPLRDGMNLVAKEFVAARDDEDGVLILSTFAGASRELVEALLVNPFDVAETETAIALAMTMPRGERRERMRMMRRTVQENSVYRWAGRLLTDAARIQQRKSLLTRHVS
jgi:trehalose 6-phosphate synthase